MVVPLIIGLATGIAFMIVLSIAINPPFPQRYGHADDATDEDKARIASILNKSKQLEPVELFLQKYPFADVGIYQYGNLPFYNENGDEIGSKFMVTFVYSGSTISRIEYEEVRFNNLLVSYHYPSLWVTVDEQGNLEEVSLRCGIKYPGNSVGGATSVRDYDVVVGLLNAKVCWWT